jgi:uncharacterized membrane protein
MVRFLIVAAIAWPAALGGALAARVHDSAPVVAGVIYLSASRVCHQRPERSFHWHGVSWPVCGRCGGLYLGGAAGAIAAAFSLRRKRRAPHTVAWLAVAAIPTVLTIAMEWTGAAAVTTAARAVTALPLGALVAFVVVRTAAGSPRAIE